MIIKTIPFIATALILSCQVALAEIKTFTKEYTYTASELDSKITSRFNALEQAKRLLLEELGTFMTSLTVVNNSQLTKDEITTLSAGIVSAIVFDEKWDGSKYWLKAKINADPTVVEQAISAIRNDSKKTTELDLARKRIEQLSKDLEAVKANLGSNPQERQKKYTEIVNQKQAMDWMILAFNKMDFKKTFAENKEALDAINKALEIDPTNVSAYVMRSGIYSELTKDYQKALNDMSLAIKYFVPSSGENDLKNPFENSAMLYEGRGYFYFRTNKLALALADFMKALEIDPSGILQPSGMFKDADIELFVKKLPKDYRSYIIRARYNSHFISGSGVSDDYKVSNASRIKKYDSAIADIKKALIINGKTHIAYYILTQAYRFKAQIFDVGHIDVIDTVNHKAIIDASTKGLALAGSNEWKERYLSTRADEYINTKEYRLAIKDFDSRANLYPDNSSIYHDRAIAYKELGELNNALDDITKAINLRPKTSNYLQTDYELKGTINSAMKNYKDAIADYTSAYDLWFKQFGAFHKENKTGSGVAYDLVYKRAEAHRKANEPLKAIEDYRLALEWMNLYTVYSDIGDTYMDMEKPEEAVKEYSKALSVSHESDSNKKEKEEKTDVVGSSYYVKIAQAYGRTDKVDKMFENYNLAINAIDNLPPLKEEIYRDMGINYQGIGINKEALRCFRNAVESAESTGTAADFMTYTLLGSTELEAGNNTEAFQTYNKLVNLYPKAGTAYVARGYAYLSIGNYKEAIADLTESLDLMPTNAYAYLQRATAYFKLSQNDKGINDLRISARLGNTDAKKILKDNNLEE